MHKEPLNLTRDEIDLLRDTLQRFGMLTQNHTVADACMNLHAKLTKDVPVFPCYLLTWPGVTSEEVAPVLSDVSAFPGECFDCGSSPEALRGKVCTALNCPLVTAGICYGSAAAQHVAEMAEGERIKQRQVPPYSEPPDALRSCPVCAGSGDAGNAAIGHRTCNECDGTGRVLTIQPGHVVSLLTDAQNDFNAGQGSRAFATVLQVVAHLAARLNSAERITNPLG